MGNNFILSSLNREERREFINFLKSFYLEYRDHLNISADVTFGIEIEYLGVDPKLVDFYINETMRDWNSFWDFASVRDQSVPFGGEINSNIMYDDGNCWKDIQNICQFLKNSGAKEVVDTAGGHIHIGANIFGNDCNKWRKFIKLYAIFEDVLYRFGYGNKINGRENIKFFAKPLSDSLISRMWKFNYANNVGLFKNIMPRDRGYGFNLKHVNFDDLKAVEGNTIEFRFFNATNEEVIWQNNINVLVKFLLAVLNTDLEENYLDILLKEEEYSRFETGTVDYNKINFPKALLLADLIFDNILDKIYFLKQYLKDFQVTHEKKLVLAKRFIK